MGRYVAFAGSTILGVMVLAGPAAAETVVEAAQIAIDGTVFRIKGTDGTVLPQASLPGTVIVINDGAAQLALRIETVERHPRDPEIMVYRISARRADGAWQDVCKTGPDGLRLAFPLSGAWAADGRHVHDDTRFGLTCTGGAIGKCVIWGYKPWQSDAMWAHHQACVRMVRADYCGDGIGTTRNGMLIDVWDRIGLLRPDRPEYLSFEAAWRPDGAACVARTRVTENATLDTLLQSCPEKLAGRLGTICTEESVADQEDVLLLNGS